MSLSCLLGLSRRRALFYVHSMFHLRSAQSFRAAAGVTLAVVTMSALSSCAYLPTNDPELYVKVDALSARLDLAKLGTIVYSKDSGTGLYNSYDPERQVIYAGKNTSFIRDLAGSLTQLGLQSEGDTYWKGGYRGAVVTVEIVEFAKGDRVLRRADGSHFSAAVSGATVIVSDHTTKKR